MPRAATKTSTRTNGNGAGTKRAGRAATKKVVEAKRGIILDIGCGLTKYPGAVGMDAQALPDVDVVHDWDVFPWPFESDSVLSIIASHVVEHVNPLNGHFIRWMNEAWRCLKPYGKIAIVAPYAGSGYYYRDPTHVNPCTEETWFYFCAEHSSKFWLFYKPMPFRLEQNDFVAHGMMEVVLRKIPYDPDFDKMEPDGLLIT